MNFLKALFGPKQKLQLIRRLSSRVRLDEWRATEDLVKSARRVLNDPEFQVMLDVLKNEHPHTFVRWDDAPIEMRAVMQARSEGYSLAIANLEAMGAFQKKQEPLEPTYEQPEQPTE